MGTGIILAGGASTRMPGDKTVMEVSGRRVIEIQLEVVSGLFDEVLLVVNRERLETLRQFECAAEGVRVVEEPVGGKGPLGGILSGLLLSGSEETFVLACDMPFVKREAIAHVMEGLAGCQVSVPVTPKGLEPLHAAYHRSCIPVIRGSIEAGNLKVTGFYEDVTVHYVPWEELLRFDPSGRLLMNINEPEDMRRAAGVRGGLLEEES